jgi:heme/copper-type cytochrome/quinol oxidase subunit 3
MALAAARAGDKAGLVRNLLLTVALGAAFLAGQGYEFSSLIREGMTPASSVFGSSFFTLTSFHGMHVLVGLLWALRNLVKSQRGDFAGGRELGVEIFGLYWHFVDIVWIVLFTVIYLL